MIIIVNHLILLITDTFLILVCFSIFVCIWIIILYYLLIGFNVIKNNIIIYFDFITSKYLDMYWFSLGIFFVTILLLRLCLLLYYSWLSLIVFDLCKVIAYQWYWVFFIFKDNVIFSNLLTESDYYIGDLRLLQCNNNLNLLSLVVYKLWLTSIDVIHSFTLATLGIKVDCIPGRCNEVIILNNCTGTYYGMCSELCGVLHGFMPIVVEFF